MLQKVECLETFWKIIYFDVCNLCVCVAWEGLETREFWSLFYSGGWFGNKMGRLWFECYGAALICLFAEIEGKGNETI